jgi:group I intron endonuclease
MIIYKTTNLVNGKIYIGQDCKNNPNYYGSGSIIIKAIKKYGKENFKKEILDFCSSLVELNEKEKYWINKLDAKNKNIGYNILDGGGNGPMPIEVKLKLSKKLKGRIFTDEHKLKISKNHHNVSGENNPMFGKTHSEDTKKYMVTLNSGRKQSLITKLKHSENAKGEKNSNAKLKENDVVLIRELYFKENIKQIELSELFNVGQTAISKIVIYKTWKHI